MTLELPDDKLAEIFTGAAITAIARSDVISRAIEAAIVAEIRSATGGVRFVEQVRAALSAQIERAVANGVDEALEKAVKRSLRSLAEQIQTEAEKRVRAAMESAT